MQAQDYAGAKWALAQRTRARVVSEGDIEHEINSGALLRTHVLRPTWHFVAPDDIRWLLALTAPRISAAMAHYNRRLELTPAAFRISNDVLREALAGGKQLTRSELRSHLEAARLGRVTGQRLGHLIMQAELDAVVCSGARRGKHFTYALLDERVPPTASRDRDESLVDLTLRYFRTRGPATPRDFAWWSGLRVTDARRGIEIAGRALEAVTIDGQRNWIAPRHRLPRRKSPIAHLLPNYDEYFIGFRDRSAIGRRVGHVALATRSDALMTHLVFIDGQLVGGWKRTFDKGRVIVHLQLLSRLSRAEKLRVAAQVQRFGKFLGLTAELR